MIPSISAWAIKAQDANNTILTYQILCIISFVESLWLGFTSMPFGFEAYTLLKTWDIAAMNAIPISELIFRNVMSWGAIAGIVLPIIIGFSLEKKCVRVTEQEMQEWLNF